MREMNGKYVGNRPVRLKRSTWKDRAVDNANSKLTECRFKKNKSKIRKKYLLNNTNYNNYNSGMPLNNGMNGMNMNNGMNMMNTNMNMNNGMTMNNNINGMNMGMEINSFHSMNNINNLNNMNNMNFGMNNIYRDTNSYN